MTELLVKAAFEKFDKWATYQTAFDLMDKRKITLAAIVTIAEKAGIKPAVIKSRRREFLAMRAPQ